MVFPFWSLCDQKRYKSFQQSMEKKDYAKFYHRAVEKIRQKPNWVRAISIADKVLVFGFVAAYAVFLAIVLLQKPFDWLYTANKVGLPALCFMAVSLLRRLIKRPRPYEKAGAGIDPLIKKAAEGNSMPSRHLASAAVLSLIFFPECIWLGIVALVATELLSLLRFLQGAHYPTDLLVGELLGFAFGAIGFLF